MDIVLDKIYNMDSMDGMRLMADKSVDMIVTDPPYLYDRHGGGGQAALAKRNNGKRDEIDFIAQDFDYESCFSEFMRLCKIPNIFIFCSVKQIGRTLTWFQERGLSVNLLVWQKTNPSPVCNFRYVADCEYIVFAHGKGSCFNNDMPFEWKKKIYSSNICPDGKLHPTQKPVDLIRRYILLHSRPNDVVLDPFIGSGTTAVACLRENRHFVGFEKDKKFFDIANNRLMERQLPLFWL